MTEALVCSACGTPHAATERFCPDCGMPLVHAPEVAAAAPPPTAAQQRARKVQARYADGPLVTVAAARHQAEAEFLQGLLLEEGVPSMLRRSGGFDVPDFLAAGPRDVLVPEAGAEAAREVLRQAELAPPPAGPRSRPRPLGLVVAIVAGGLVSAGVAWLLLQLAG